jgi:hypothetical protein
VSGEMPCWNSCPTVSPKKSATLSKSPSLIPRSDDRILLNHAGLCPHHIANALSSVPRAANKDRMFSTNR